jgi:phosphate transport system substrate-binding protein
MGSMKTYNQLVGILSILLAFSSCTSESQSTLVIQNKGSDTVVNLAQAWAEEYRKVNPKVAIAVSGGGSGTGIAALINGTVDIANSSRPIKKEESTEAFKNNNKEVKEHVIGIDALAVFIHPNNPLKGLSMKEVACIFGEDGTCTHWHHLRNTTVPGCQNNKIIRVSRQSNSGTYQYFREAILGKTKDLKLGSMDLNGSKEAIDLVENTPCAIGYTGMGYLNPHVKALCLSNELDEECISPTLQNAMTRKYPISRNLYMYTLGEPQDEILKYFNWIRTEVAQELIIRSGYVPLHHPKYQYEKINTK